MRVLYTVCSLRDSAQDCDFLFTFLFSVHNIHINLDVTPGWFVGEMTHLTTRTYFLWWKTVTNRTPAAATTSRPTTDLRHSGLSTRKKTIQKKRTRNRSQSNDFSLLTVGIITSHVSSAITIKFYNSELHGASFCCCCYWGEEIFEFNCASWVSVCIWKSKAIHLIIKWYIYIARGTIAINWPIKCEIFQYITNSCLLLLLFHC